MTLLSLPQRNRTFALAAVGYVAFFYGTLGLMPLLMHWLFKLCGRSGYSLAINSFLVAVALGVVWLMRRDLTRVGPWRLMGLAGVAAGFWLVVLWADSPTSRLHALQYGGLAVLVTGSLRGMLPPWRMHLTAAAIVLTAGLIDEGLQGFIPSRSALWVEVFQNWGSATLAQCAMMLLTPHRAPRTARSPAVHTRGRLAPPMAPPSSWLPPLSRAWPRPAGHHLAKRGGVG